MLTPSYPHVHPILPTCSPPLTHKLTPCISFHHASFHPKLPTISCHTIPYHHCLTPQPCGSSISLRSIQNPPQFLLSRFLVPAWVLLTAPACPQTSCRQCPRALHCTACSRLWHQNLGPCAQSRDEADSMATVGVRATLIRFQHTHSTLSSPHLQPSFMAKGWPLHMLGSSESSCFISH